jgi:hypothetical protein
MLEVKSVTLPITLLEKDCTPVTIEAAKAPPGRFGKEIPPPPPPPDEVETGLGVAPRPKDGS